MRKQKYSITTTTVQPWINKHPAIQNYLKRLNSQKLETACNLHLYCTYTNKTPQQLLDLKHDYLDFAAEKLLDNFAATNPLNLPESKLHKTVMHVRAFYRVNYRQLQAESGRIENLVSKERPTQKKEMLNQLLRQHCYNPRDKSIFLINTGSAVARETLAYLRWDMLEPDWKTQKTPHLSIPGEYIKGHGRGKYRGIRQETFLTPAAKQQLLYYRQWYSRCFNYVWKPNDNIFLHIKRHIGVPLNSYDIDRVFIWLKRRSGGTYNSHDGRRIVQTALESVSCPNNWIKKIKGRKCSGEEAPYSKPAIEQLRLKYGEALNDIDFTVEEQPRAQTKNEIHKLRSENDALKNRLDRIEKLVQSFMQKNYEMLKI